MARLRSISGQLDLFEPEPSRPSQVPQPQPPDPELAALAAGLPPGLWLGTSSWSFPGWAGLVYAGRHPESRLAREGLRAYAQHPLLRAVGIDRSYYSPVPLETYSAYAAEVPEDFRFLVKAPELLTLARFLHHPRYGERQGQPNPDFLCPLTALQHWVEPVRQGLGSRLGCLLLQFPPQALPDLRGARGFAASLYQFLEAMPAGLPWAVELRNRELLTPAYLEVLQRWDACHCLNIHPHMPELGRQLEAVRDAPLAVVRWMLNPSLPGRYQEAVDRFEPFDRLQEEDPTTRLALARLCRERCQGGLPTMVIVNNKAEGCAPLSLRALAQAVT